MERKGRGWVALYAVLLVLAISTAGWALGEVRHGDPEPLSVASLIVTCLVYGGAAAAASYLATRLTRLLGRRTAPDRTR